MSETKDRGGWIEWNGGECPVDGMVEFRCRDGYSDTADALQLATSQGCDWWSHTQERASWNCTGDCRDDDIIAYRIAGA
ncbi:hypothetical protein LB533_20210 [Mesorhizobium sp. BR1-1-13]|uniref:hypothetical protein n=1 Tax=Mesorhizobium sp. BR1-1-13 TaxID=2876656 RepID=UPI001CD14386|nr:hypothetical protein [Mesorhizobium sp. BR1-1-13]MBZ9943413.1 hypothetical protein [Mesorhizobium sp. BR1-1-13]